MTEVQESRLQKTLLMLLSCLLKPDAFLLCFPSRVYCSCTIFPNDINRSSLFVHPHLPTPWVRSGRSDRRPYVRAAYALFAGDCDEKELAKQMETGSSSANGKKSAREGAQSVAAYFYANLYLGLYSEARGDATLAQKCGSRHGRGIAALWAIPQACASFFVHASWRSC